MTWKATLAVRISLQNANWDRRKREILLLVVTSSKKFLRFCRSEEERRCLYR